MPIYSDVIARLDEKSVQDTMRAMESQFASGGTTLGETFTRAFSAAGSNFSAGLSDGVRQSIGDMGALGKAAESALSRIPVGAAAAATGIGLIAVAAVQVGQALYDVGSRFDAVSDRIAARTNSLGEDMDRLNETLRESFRNSASSLEEVGAVLTGVTQSLHLTGQAAVDVTNQIDDFNRMTGDSLNIRNLGRVLAQFGVDAGQAGNSLDMLYTASSSTGVPINELVTNLSNAGPAARTLGLTLGELTFLFGIFEAGGIDAGRAQQALNNAAKVFADSGVPLQTGLADTITQIRGFIDAGNDAAAVDLAGKVFGERGAQRFVDLIGRGKLSVEDLNTELQGTQGAIEAQNEATRDWAEQWATLKNRVTDLAEEIGGPLFDALNGALGVLNALMADYSTMGENISTGPGMVPAVPFTPGALMPGVPLPAGAAGAAAPVPADAGALSGQFPWLAPSLNLPTPGPGDGRAPQDIAGAIENSQAAGGSGLSAPQIPYPADYGEPPQPGETPEQWQRRMQIMDAQHDVAEKQAALNQLEGDNTADQNDIIGARNDLINAQIRQTQLENQQVAVQQQAVQVPMPGGYGAAPRPGQNAQQYAAEQAMFEAQHKRAEATARLAQIEADSTATAEDLIKATNDLNKARVDENQAQLRLQESTGRVSDMLGEVGSQLDADFGVSKGLSGIVDNVTRMLAGFAAAPIVGALSGAQAGLGYRPGEAGAGLMGILASSGAFGSQYVRGAGGAAADIAPYNPAVTVSPRPSLGSPRPAAGVGVGGYPGDAALLANVPSGSYAQTQAADLTRGLGDCSSAVEDLVNLMDGRPTAGREMATGNAAEWLTSRGFLPGSMPGAFNVAFNSGHMQATLPGGTPFNWGSDSAAANRGVGGSGAADPALTQRYYRPVGAGVGGGAASSVLMGGQSIPLPLPVIIVGGAPAGVLGALPGLPGLDTSAAPSTPGAASGARPFSPAAPGRAAAGVGAGAGGGYLPLTPEQLTGTGLTNPIPAAAGGGGGLIGGAAGATPTVPTTGQPGGGSAASAPAGAFFPGLAGPPQSLPGLGFPAPGGGPNPSSTLIGGLAPPQGSGSGFGGMSGGILGAALGAASSAAGLAASGAAMGMDGGAGGAAASAAMQIGVQLINRAVAQGGQVAGIAASGLIETLVPFGASELAQNNWLTKIVGGIVGARPVLPNMAGGAGKKTPDGLTPEQAAQFQAGQDGPTPQQVAGDPANPGQGGGSGGGRTINNNVTVNNQRPTEDGTGRDVTWHLGQMYSGPGQ